jgi:hypothetical protein
LRVETQNFASLHRPYVDKKYPGIQVENGDKTGGFPSQHLLFQNIKKAGGGFQYLKKS